MGLKYGGQQRDCGVQLEDRTFVSGTERRLYYRVELGKQPAARLAKCQ